MRLHLKGPEAAQARMEELQAKVRQFQQPDSASKSEFKDFLEGAPMSRLDGAAPFNPFQGGVRLRSEASHELRGLISQAAQEAGIDPKLLDAMVAIESGYNPTARSHVGAMGLTQLMPGTARELGISDPFDPAQNLRGGAKYLSGLLKQFGDPRLALAAYNAGPQRVINAGNSIPNIPETQRHVARVMALYERGIG